MLRKPGSGSSTPGDAVVAFGFAFHQATASGREARRMSIGGESKVSLMPSGARLLRITQR